MKKPELAFKRFIRFLLARAAMTWGVELMAGAFRVYQFYRQGRMGRVIIMKNAAKGGGGEMTDELLYRSAEMRTLWASLWSVTAPS